MSHPGGCGRKHGAAMNQLPLELPARARNTDPDTSKDAADSMSTARLTAIVHEVMLLYGERGCISDEVELAMRPIRSHSVTPRFKTMIEAGMIELTGEKRKASSGKMQLVRRALPPPWVKVRRTATLEAADKLEPIGYIGADCYTLVTGGEKVSGTFSPIKICDDDVPLYAAPQVTGEKS